MSGPQNYYMISNRSYDSTTGAFGSIVAMNGTLTFLSAPVSDPSNFSVTPYETWLEAVQNDLETVREGRKPAGGPFTPVPPSLATLFVHGYGVSFDHAESAFSTYFQNLANPATGNYPGVLIGFDWPSDDIGVWQPGAFQSAKGKAQTTAAESFPTQSVADSLPRLLQVLNEIQSIPVDLTAMCHSMGNYLMFLGAGVFSPARGVNPFFSQILCVAAMLENSAFNSSTSQTYCKDIVDAAGRVTVYYSGNDDVLPQAEKSGYDGYPELGIWGPTYGDGTLLSGVAGVDCSAVVNKTNAKIYEAGQAQVLTHTSYFFIPEVLKDIGQTLQGWNSANMPDRTRVLGTSSGYTMTAIT